MGLEQLGCRRIVIGDLVHAQRTKAVAGIHLQRLQIGNVVDHRQAKVPSSGVRHATRSKPTVRATGSASTNFTRTSSPGSTVCDDTRATTATSHS